MSSCIFKPYVNDKPSAMYDGLLTLAGNRSLANYLVAP